MTERARAHVDRFNAAVSSGDRESFVAGFTGWDGDLVSSLEVAFDE